VIKRGIYPLTETGCLAIWLPIENATALQAGWTTLATAGRTSKNTVVDWRWRWWRIREITRKLTTESALSTEVVWWTARITATTFSFGAALTGTDTLVTRTTALT